MSKDLALTAVQWIIRQKSVLSVLERLAQNGQIKTFEVTLKLREDIIMIRK